MRVVEDEEEEIPKILYAVKKAGGTNRIGKRGKLVKREGKKR